MLFEKTLRTAAATVAFLASGSATARADEARFVPEATEVSWDGTVATVSFQEVDVVVEGAATTISVKVTVDVDVVCTKGESTLDIHRSATALAATDYPVQDGTVTGTAKLPLKVKGPQPPGYSCAVRHRSVTAVLEDFLTGATLVREA